MVKPGQGPYDRSALMVGDQAHQQDLHAIERLGKRWCDLKLERGAVLRPTKMSDDRWYTELINGEDRQEAIVVGIST